MGEELERTIGRLEQGFADLKEGQARMERRVERIDEKLDTLLKRHSDPRAKVAGIAATVGIGSAIAVEFIKSVLAHGIEK